MYWRVALTKPETSVESQNKKANFDELCKAPSAEDQNFKTKVLRLCFSFYWRQQIIFLTFVRLSFQTKYRKLREFHNSPPT